MEEAPPRAQPWNVVVMGMGEPLLNYEATVSALRVLMDPEGFAVAPRKLTLSTVGILPALEKLMQEPVRPNLAISLHAPNQALRRVLMPIEEKYALADVMAAALRYPIPRGGLVTFEYVLLRGVNDRPAHARELVRLLGGPGISFRDGAGAMVGGGDWRVPRYRGEPFSDKPALTYWLMALSMLWLGPSPAAARAVAALAALLVLVVTLALGRLLFDRRTALPGGLGLA